MSSVHWCHSWQPCFSVSEISQTNPNCRHYQVNFFARLFNLQDLTNNGCQNEWLRRKYPLPDIITGTMLIYCTSPVTANNLTMKWSFLNLHNSGFRTYWLMSNKISGLLFTLFAITDTANIRGNFAMIIAKCHSFKGPQWWDF